MANLLEVRIRLNIDAVESFAMFADCMSFSAAARRLHISQPSLHVKIRKLSDQLGLPLYHREGRLLRLTAHGERVARFGRELLEQTGSFVRALKGDSDPERVNLAAGEGAYLYLLGAGIRRFLRSGRTQLQLLTRDRESAVDAVLGGKAHVGVAPLDVVPSDVDAHVLTDVGQMLVVPADHALAKRRRLELKDLDGLSLIVPPEDRPHRQVLARLLQSAGVPWTVAVEAIGWELTVRFVQMGVGLAVVNAACTLPRGLRGVPIPALPGLRYHAFHRKGAPRNPVVRKLIDDLRHHANDWKTA